MYSDLSTEQRAHELALHAVLHNRRLLGEPITTDDAFEFAIEYRNLLKRIRKSILEGQSDLE